MNIEAIEQALAVDSPYMPRVGKIMEVEKFTDNETWYRFEFADGKPIEYKAGQFVEVSIFGIGEAPISICSGAGTRNDLEMCVRNVGDVTGAMATLGVGDTIGLRGAFGNGFDMKTVEGMDLLFVAGGLGLAPCRSFIQTALAEPDKYGKITILYGARSPQEMLFTKDLEAWDKSSDCEFLMTVDRPDDAWTGYTGVITKLFKKIEKPDPASTAAFIIGPPVMFKFAVLEALMMKLRKANIFCSLERRMKCGLGKCGHCQIRDVYVCQEGPIFNYAEVSKLREGI